MPRDRSILLVANARPLEIGKLYFFRDRGMRRLMEHAGAASIDTPSLRRWTESSAWLDAHAKSELSAKAAQRDSGAILAPFASRKSAVEAPTGRSNGEIAQEEHSAIDVEISDAIAGISAEAQRAAQALSPDAMEGVRSALNEFAGIIESMRKAWGAP